MVSEVPIKYSHCSNRCWVPVRCVSFGRSVNVSSRELSAVSHIHILLKQKPSAPTY